MSSIPARRELLAWMLAVVLALTAVLVSRPDRVQAGVSGPTTEVVYIATGANFPDALAAAATAALGLGPVLLVQLDAIPTPTLNELNRLQPGRIVIVGGEAVISAGVESQLNSLAFSPEVTRIAGANRFATAAELSQAHFPTTGLYPRAAFAASNDLGSGPGGLGIQLQVEIVAPAAGILLIDAGVGFTRTITTDVITCRIDVNASFVTGSFREIEIGDGLAEKGHCTTVAAVPVAAGTHVIQYRGFVGTSTSQGGGALTVLWVPFDSNGAVPIP